MRQEAGNNMASPIAPAALSNADEQRPGTSFLLKTSQSIKSRSTLSLSLSEATPKSFPEAENIQGTIQTPSIHNGVETGESETENVPIQDSVFDRGEQNAQRTAHLAAPEAAPEDPPPENRDLHSPSLPTKMSAEERDPPSPARKRNYAELVRDREVHRQRIQQQQREYDRASRAGASQLQPRQQTEGDHGAGDGATIDDLCMNAGLTSAFRSLGTLTSPTPPQIAAISACRSRRDAIVSMRSGAHRLEVIAALLAEKAWSAPAGETIALMLTPTKDAAKETAKLVGGLLALAPSAPNGVAVAQLIGSRKVSSQAAALKSARVAVGTFQRAATLVASGDLRAQHLRLVVLDDPNVLEQEENGPLAVAVEAVRNWLPARRKILAFGEAVSKRAVERLRVWMGPFQRVDLEGDSGRGGGQARNQRPHSQKRRKGKGGAFSHRRGSNSRTQADANRASPLWSVSEGAYPNVLGSKRRGLL